MWDPNKYLTDEWISLACFLNPIMLLRRIFSTRVVPYQKTQRLGKFRNCGVIVVETLIRCNHEMWVECKIVKNEKQWITHLYLSHPYQRTSKFKNTGVVEQQNGSVRGDKGFSSRLAGMVSIRSLCIGSNAYLDHVCHRVCKMLLNIDSIAKVFQLGEL